MTSSPPPGAQGADQPLGSRYRIGERIGHGSVGDVHRGVDGETGQDVAVKLLRTEFARDHEIVGRFLRELSILQDLRHDNIVQVRDIVLDQGRLAIIMELVEGRDLTYRLNRGVFEVETAARITSGTLRALAYAHEQGVIHRDLKPENILLSGDDVPKLSDFGISRLTQGSRASRTSQIVGTPEYIAPESFTDPKNVGPAIDIYAAGILFYELVEGQTPFAGAPPYAMMQRHIEEEPERPESISSDAVWAVVAATLAKDPAARPGASELADAFAAIAEGRIPELDLADHTDTLKLGKRTRRGTMHVVTPATAKEAAPDTIELVDPVATQQRDRWWHRFRRSQAGEAEGVQAEQADRWWHRFRGSQDGEPETVEAEQGDEWWRRFRRSDSRETDAVEVEQSDRWWQRLSRSEDGEAETVEPRPPSAATRSPSTPSEAAEGPQAEASPEGGPDEPSTRRRPALAAAAALVVLAGAAAAFALQGGGNTQPEIATLAGDAAAAAAPPAAPTVELAFPLRTLQDGATVSRSWQLEGDDGGSFSGESVVTNATDAPLAGRYVLVIPKELAADVSDITFDPEPSEILDADPVVAYDYELAPGGDLAIRYQIDVPADGLDAERLQSWAGAQDQAEREGGWVADEILEPEVAELVVEPLELTLAVGETAGLTITANDQDGKPVEAALTWTTSDGSIAAVLDGVVTGIAPGTTTVSAGAGDVVAEISVTVEADEIDEVVEALPETPERPRGESGGAPPQDERPRTETPSGSAPGAVRNVKATAGLRSVKLSWDPPSSGTAAKYRITSKPGGVSKTTTSRSINLTGLEPAVGYQFTIVAMDSRGRSGPSASSPRATPYAPPAAPQGITVTAESSDTVVVAWDRAKTYGWGVTEYIVKGSPYGSATVSANQTWATVSGLKGGGTYTFRVIARSKVGDSEPSAATAPLALGVPTRAPTITSAEAVATGSIKVTWSEVGLNGAILRRYEVSVNGGAPVSTGFFTVYNGTGFADGEDLSIRVRAVTDFGQSPWSASVTVQTAGAPDQITTLAVHSGSGSLLLSWSAPASNGAQILRYEVDRFGASVVNASRTTYEWEGLTPGQSYKVRVRACNAFGCGDWSPFKAGTPK